MKVLLIPPIVNPFTKNRNDNFMPLGLLSLAANIQINGNNVKIYHPTIQLHNKTDFKRAAKDILKTEADLIGFSTWCITYPASLLIAEELKTQAPEIPIIFGGPHASVVAKKTLTEFPFVDYVIRGEADYSFPDFLMELVKSIPNFSVVAGLSYRTKDGKIVNNRLNEIVSNLDELPIPAYELIPETRWIKLDVGRGCPFHCTYCSTNQFFSKKYRTKSAGRIIEEMMLAYQRKKINTFSFAHDMFTLNKEFVFELCDKLISIKKGKGIEFTWTCSARIDCVSKVMLYKMKEAGCTDIFFGIETGSSKMQKVIKKNLKVNKAYEIADICRQNGINMHASFIVGFPEERQQDINESLSSALKLAVKGALVQVSELTLLPGTPIYESNFIELKFDGQFSNFSRNLCGQEELKLIKKYPDIFSSFYYLPVKSIGRQEMLFLRYLINKSNHFKNTFFLLSEIIKQDLEKTNLLSLYKEEYKRVTTKGKVYDTITFHWINIIDQYILKNEDKITVPFLKDVFAFESFSALLKSLFSKWRIITKETKRKKYQLPFKIKPTPVWKVLITSYKLEKTLPSENNWGKNKYRYSKGNYKYLLVAVSEVNCKRIRINSKEEFLLENLSELFFSDYVKKVKKVVTEKEALLWIKKMRRLGVVEILTE